MPETQCLKTLDTSSNNQKTY